MVEDQEGFLDWGGMLKEQGAGEEPEAKALIDRSVKVYLLWEIKGYLKETIRGASGKSATGT